MKDASKKNKIGFILRSIHFGSSLKLWRRLSNYATQYSGSFFVFPGGTIDEQKNSEKFRNEIYKLVNSENLDGIISWSSSIGGESSSEEIEKFHSNFNNIPFITIGRKIGNNINVSFDAYSGMKELVLHFCVVLKIIYLQMRDLKVLWMHWRKQNLNLIVQKN